jgi:RING finger protein 113A
MGPVKAPTFVRVTSRFDYQPDICKDYKETGFCGFGDSCKFLHDRGDYKSGWQLELEWDAEQARKKKKLEESIAGFGDDAAAAGGGGGDDSNADNEYAIDRDDEDLPFACFLCREDFKNPVVTVCGHYFCGDCAMNACKKNGNKCPICTKQTFGVFNRAHKLLKKIAEKKGTATAEGAGGGGGSSASAPIVRKGTWEAV